MKKKHTVIIIDGIDNVGKSTTISNLQSVFENCHLLNSTDAEFDKFRQPMKEFNKLEDVSLINDVVSPSRLQQYLKQMHMIISANPEASQTFIFDRLLLAPLVYGNVLRHKEFNEIWKNNSYKRYIQAFIDTIQQSENIDLIHIVAIRHENFVFVDDMKNYLVQIYATQLESANMMFNKYSDEFATIKVYVENGNFDRLTEVVIAAFENLIVNKSS